MARILVVGGSLGGLFAANLLVRDGHDVVVLEKSPRSLDGRGAGIVTHPALLEGLRRAGAVVDDTLGVSVSQRRVFAQSGEVEATLEMPQILTSWGRIYQLLSELLPPACYRMGNEVTALEETQSTVTAIRADGSSVSGELMIASDGLRSTVRSLLAPAVQPEYAGYVAWRGTCDESVLTKSTRTSLFGYFGFCLPPGEQMLGYPVAGPENSTSPGRRRYNFVWYRAAPEGEQLIRLLTDDAGHYHPLGIPPHRVSRANLDRMRCDGRALLSPQFAEVLEKTVQPFLQPICDVASERIAFGRIVLVGDAAFVARPHVGMGVTKAAEDGMALAACIRSHGACAQALAAYEDLRLGAGRRVVERGRQLGAYMQQQGMPQNHKGFEVGRDPARVLRETAVEMREDAGPTWHQPQPA